MGIVTKHYSDKNEPKSMGITGATVGQIAKITAVDSDGKPTAWSPVDMPEQVQVNWNQNDSTAADYIKNRPGAYKVEKEIKVTVPPGDTSSVILESFPSFKPGETINFAVNSVKYSVEAVELFPDDPGVAVISDAKGGWGIICLYGDDGSVIAHSKTEAINIAYTSIINVVIPSEFLPSNIVYSSKGNISTSLLPTDLSVFGGPLVGGTETYSTLNNPYPNKVQMRDLTSDKFNQMLNDSIYVPNIIILGGGEVATVYANILESCIYVEWFEATVYGIDGHSIGGAKVSAYQAKIHEDAENKGSIVSECAIIKIADNRLA